MSIFLCAVEYPGPAEHPGGSHREECRVRGSETKGETDASSRFRIRIHLIRNTDPDTDPDPGILG
jgi:hypothetical protein